MVLVNATYTDKTLGLDIMMSRTINDDDDLRMVIGEVLYGIEVQCHTFETDDIFNQVSMNIPKSFKSNCTVAAITLSSEEDVDDISLAITLTGKRLGSMSKKK